MAIAFIIGLLVGLWGRPLVIKESPPPAVVVTVVPNSQEIAKAIASELSALSSPLPTPPTARQEEALATAEPGPQIKTSPTPSVMEFVLADARHFQGEANAPVTLIEFSDFK